MTEIYDRTCAQHARRLLPRLQLLAEARAVRSRTGRTIGDAPARPGRDLRPLQRNDDTENALEYFCAPRHRGSTTFDLFCRLRRSGVARRNSENGADQAIRVQLDPKMNRPAIALQHRTISIQRARFARVDRRLREETRAEENRPGAWRSAARSNGLARTLPQRYQPRK